MKLIKIDSKTFVNPNTIQTVEIDRYDNRILIHTEQDTYSMPAEYGKGIYETLDKFIKLVNEDG